MKKVKVDGLEPREQELVTAGLEKLDMLEERNTRLQAYMDAEYVVKALTVTEGPTASRLRAVSGWPAKALRALSVLCHNEGVAAVDGKDYGLTQWWTANHLDVEASQALDQAMLYGPSFLVTGRGDEANGEPDIITTVCPATAGTGTWNPRTRRLDWFLSVHDVAPKGKPREGQPLSMTLYVPGRTTTMHRNGTEWVVEGRGTGLPFVPVAPLVYQFRHDRHFGSSRISKPIMDITDNAVRTIIRAEQGAEAYINPQRYMLGADMEQFADDSGQIRPDLLWKAMLGRLVAIGPNDAYMDEDDNRQPVMPQVGQFPQLDMTPHLAQLESYAAAFAAEADLPPSSVGITKTQNPASAEAIIAAKDDLINLAAKTMREASTAWTDTAMTVHMLRENLTKVPADLRFRTRWRNPRTPSPGAQADAVVKLTSGDRPIIPPESDYALEMLGLTQAEIERVQEDRKRLAVKSDIAALADRIASRAGAAPTATAPDAQPALDGGTKVTQDVSGASGTVVPPAVGDVAASRAPANGGA